MKTNYALLILLVILGFLLQEKCLSQVPYVPTPESIVNEMLSVAKVTSSDVVYDLGCGDGRIVVIAAKKFGARGVGIDNNPARIRDSWANAKRNGLTYQVNFIEQDLFETNLRDATVVTLYLLTNINLKLRPKLFKELKPGTRVVSNSFSMDNWEPDSLIDIEGRNLYYWKIPANASGVWDVDAVGGEGNNKYTLYLEQVFQKLEGSLEVGGQKYYLMPSKVDGDILTFRVNKKSKDEKEIMVFTLNIKDDQMKGTVSTDQNDELVNFTAKRREGTMKPLDPKLAAYENKFKN